MRSRNACAPATGSTICELISWRVLRSASLPFPLRGAGNRDWSAYPTWSIHEHRGGRNHRAYWRGAQFNISDPTAAFVVILLPITQQYGLGGLLIATIVAAVILIVMGLAHEPPDLIHSLSSHRRIYGRNRRSDCHPTGQGFSGPQYNDARKASPGQTRNIYPGATQLQLTRRSHRNRNACDTYPLTAGRLAIPGQLMALLAGGACAWADEQLIEGFHVATIGSHFAYELNGQAGRGIPPAGLSLVAPWHLPDAAGPAIAFSFDLIRDRWAPRSRLLS